MMLRENYVRTLRGYDLELIPWNGGHTFQWHDGRGRIVLSGWNPFGKELAQMEAESRLVVALHDAKEGASNV